MNTLIRFENRWNPFREMEALQNRLNSLLGRTLVSPPEGDEKMTVAEWAPVVDIVEDDAEYLIKVELPEIKKEDVKITVADGVLNITGERKFEKEENGRKYHRVERTYGRFARCFAVPDNADPGKVNAEFTDGVLKVHLAKAEKAKPRSIEVKYA
jgi:HSP20 family protein